MPFTPRAGESISCSLLRMSPSIKVSGGICVEGHSGPRVLSAALQLELQRPTRASDRQKESPTTWGGKPNQQRCRSMVGGVHPGRSAGCPNLRWTPRCHLQSTLGGSHPISKSHPLAAAWPVRLAAFVAPPTVRGHGPQSTTEHDPRLLFPATPATCPQRKMAPNAK